MAKKCIGRPSLLWHECCEEVARLEERNAALAAALQSLWKSHPCRRSEDDIHCPECGGQTEEDGIEGPRKPHDADCPFAALSDTGEGWLPPEVK